MDFFMMAVLYGKSKSILFSLLFPCYLYEKVNADCLNEASRRFGLGIGDTIVGRVQALSGLFCLHEAYCAGN